MKSIFIKQLSISVFCCLLIGTTYGQLQLPNDFYDEVVVNSLVYPAGFTFDENGTMYVWDKNGFVQIVDTNGVKLPDPLIDISEEVGNWRDHGLLGFALDPNFSSNGFYYLWYVVDRHHLLHYGTPQYHPDSSASLSATIGRLTRYKADIATNYTTTVPNSRTILLGETKETGYPVIGEFHSGGTILFGLDGTLMLSVGDGATGAGLDTGGVVDGTFGTQALADGILTPDQDVGLYRCQYLGALNGKVLRLDPTTGDGVSSNPFYDPQNPRSPQSRTWALGLRNRFRMVLVPGTGSHVAADGDPGTVIVGDVGWHSYEELNWVDQPGMNFGWPLYQGEFRNYFINHDAPFNRMAPNPLYGTDGCDQPYFTFKDLLGKHHEYMIAPHPCDDDQTVPNIIHRFKAEPPFVSYLNEYYENPPQAFMHYYDNNGTHTVIDVEDPLSTVDATNFDGQCSIGGAFYKAGDFPEKYHGAYFHTDFRGWIRAFFFDENQKLQKIEDFLDGSDDIIGLAAHPKDGCLYYIGAGNDVHRVCFGGNPAPKAVAEANIKYGVSPLEVQLTGENSFDIFGEPITYAWDFGDGETSTDINPTHIFTTSSSDPTPINVTLTVTDSIGQTDEATLVISMNNTPPTVNITSIRDGDLYPGHQFSTLSLVADVSDVETANENLVYEWQTFLHHNEHNHAEAVDNRVSTHTTISPIGCEDDLYYFRVALSITDEHGLTTTDERYIYPYCGDPFIQIINLEANALQDSVLLAWTSNFEDSVDYYEIQRGENIWNYETIGQVDASGTSTNPIDYTFVDTQPKTGLMYYRIKGYRLDQAFNYSNREPFKFSREIVDVYPNPSDGLVNLYFAKDFETVIIRWYDAQGKEMESYQFNNVKENELQKLRTKRMSNGVYLYSIEADGQNVTGKLLFVR